VDKFIYEYDCMHKYVASYIIETLMLLPYLYQNQSNVKFG